MMTRRNKGIGRVFLRCTPRFVFSTIIFLILISLMALTEGLVVWIRWPHLVNRSSSRWVSIGDFAISANGEWGVSRINFGNGKANGTIHDVVLYNLRGQNAVRLHAERYRPQFVAASPAPVSDDVAVTCQDGSICIWSGLSDCEASFSVADRRLRLSTQVSGDFTQLAFSSDGRLLAAAGSRFVHVWRWPSGELLHKRPSQFARRYVVFSGDSRHVLSPGSGGEVCLWDAYTGMTVKTISPDNGFVATAAFSPDAKLAALLLYGWEVRLYRLASGEELWRNTRSTFRGPSITYSLDGRFLAIAGSNRGAGTIILLDAIGGQITCELRGHDAPISGLAFGPDGFLYSSDMQGVIRSWNIEQQCEQSYFSTLKWGSDNRLFHERDSASPIYLTH